MIEPRGDRPHIPGYGIPDTLDGTLPWSWAVQRLEAAIVYWLGTTGADQAPHMIPIWGAWVDGRWYVVIVEGTARELVAPAEPLSSAILAGYAKYREAAGYHASASHWAEGGLWELTPIKAFAWSVFPTDMTRFRF